MSELDYEMDRYCPAFQKTICSDLCFESIMALSRSVKVESVPELKEIKQNILSLVNAIHKHYYPYIHRDLQL